MAVCFCRWRNVFICLCSPCILLALLFAYVTVMMSMNMVGSSEPARVTSLPDIQGGLYRNQGWAPFPKLFWDQHLNLGIWNLLQLHVDRSLNPILRPHRRSGLPHTGTNVSSKSLLAEGSPGAQDTAHRPDRLAGLPPGIQEFARHMHKRDYPVVMEPGGGCGAGANDSGRTLLLLAIKTTEQNFRNRQTIRNTWGRAGWVDGQRGRGGGYVRRVFLLGSAPSGKPGAEPSRLLQTEGQTHGDILWWDFKDSFFNLTLKDVLFWEWFSGECRRTAFVFKGDDDVFVNTPALVDYLQQQAGVPGAAGAMGDFVVGDVIVAAQPDRRKDSKYFVPEAFYSGAYPPYAGGGGLVYSGLLTRHLHLVSKRVHLFPIDDVYVGMCLRRLNTHPSHHAAFLTFDFSREEEREPCAYHRTIMVHKRTPQRVGQLWKQLEERRPQCWNVTLREARRN